MPPDPFIIICIASLMCAVIYRKKILHTFNTSMISFQNKSLFMYYICRCMRQDRCIIHVQSTQSQKWLQLPIECIFCDTNEWKGPVITQRIALSHRLEKPALALLNTSHRTPYVMYESKHNIAESILACHLPWSKYSIMLIVPPVTGIIVTGGASMVLFVLKKAGKIN